MGKRLWVGMMFKKEGRGESVGKRVGGSGQEWGYTMGKRLLVGMMFKKEGRGESVGKGVGGSGQGGWGVVGKRWGSRVCLFHSVFGSGWKRLWERAEGGAALTRARAALGRNFCPSAGFELKLSEDVKDIVK